MTINKWACAHELHSLHCERWNAIKALTSDVDFLDQLEQLTNEHPEVMKCAWFDDAQEINRRVLRRLAKIEKSEKVS